MAKAQEKLLIGLDYTSTEIAFRKAAMSFGTIRDIGGGHFIIKETDNGYSAGSVTLGDFGVAISTDKTTYPTTTDIYIRNISLQQTEIDIQTKCFGIGPWQGNHCKAQLSTIKSAIIVAVSEYAKQNTPPTPQITPTSMPAQNVIPECENTSANSQLSETTNQKNLSSLIIEQPIVEEPIITENRKSVKISQCIALIISIITLITFSFTLLRTHYFVEAGTLYGHTINGFQLMAFQIWDEILIPVSIISLVLILSTIILIIINLRIIMTQVTAKNIIISYRSVIACCVINASYSILGIVVAVLWGEATTFAYWAIIINAIMTAIYFIYQKTMKRSSHN